MAKSKMTINKEILIAQSRDVIDVIMQIGGGLMPRTMLVAISDLPQYKDKKLLSQLKSLTKKQNHVMRDNKTIKEYPSFLTSTRLENHVIYTISLANARLINPGLSYTQPSFDANALVRRLQLIHHRIGILQRNPNLTVDRLSKIDSGFLTKQAIPQYLLGIDQSIGNHNARLLAAEVRHTKNALDRMAGGRKGNLPSKTERDNVFVVLKSPTILALHQMGVYIQLVNKDSYRIYIYEGRNLRDTTDIVKLIGDAVAYFGLLLPGKLCRGITIKTVNSDDSRSLRKKINTRSLEIKMLLDANNISGIKIGATNVLDDYFGGIML